MAPHFSRVGPATGELEIWNASERGFSFVISNQSSTGPGLHGRPGFVASWRPIHINKPAVRVGGSPFKTFAQAEQACEAMLDTWRDSFGRTPCSVPLTTNLPVAPACDHPKRLQSNKLSLRQRPSQVCDTNIRGNSATVLGGGARPNLIMFGHSDDSATFPSRSDTSNDDQSQQKQRDHNQLS